LSGFGALLSHPDSFKETAPTITLGLSFPVDGLHTIIANRADDLQSVWEPLLDAGILPLLCDSVKLVKSDEVMGSLCNMATFLLLAIPREGAREYLGRLPRAIAGVIKARPPMLPGRAAELRYEMAWLSEELLADYQSWGICSSLKRLTRGKDPQTVSAAEQLMLIMDKGTQVRSALLRVLLICGKMSGRQSSCRNVGDVVYVCSL
jgi:hypothetical protein